MDPLLESRKAMLTLIISVYFILTLLVGIVIYCACVVASRTDDSVREAGFKKPSNIRYPAETKSPVAKPMTTLPPMANPIYRSSSLN